MHETLPVFSMLRAPSRFGLLVTLALAIMAGIGLAKAPLVTAAGRPTLIALIAIVLSATRLVHEPLYVAPAPEPSEAHKRLVSLPTAPVVEFPFYVGGARHQHTEYMLLSTRHWKPLVNGYSDHFPAEAHETHPRLATFPDLDAWHVMRDHRVRYVLIHWYRLEHADNRRIRAGTIKFRPQLRPVVEGTDVSLYEIVSWPTELN
jgi:hypothetical protein